MESERATSDIERLHEAASRLHASRSVDECYDVAIESAVTILGFKWCVLSAPAPETDEFEIAATSGGAPAEVGDRPLRVDEGIAGHVFRTGESDIIDDVHDDPRGEPVTDDIHATVTVPVGDWGIFQAVSTTPGAYDDRDGRLAELLMTHVATAIERLERKAELERQNERLDEVATIISHDLRSPLNVAQGQLSLVRRERDDPRLDEVAEAHERMDELIDQMLTWARGGDLVEEVEPASLSAVARECWAAIDSPQAALDVRTDAIVRTDVDRLRQLLENLFRNAIEHGGRSVAVEVGDLEDGFYVADDGPGIPPEERAAVFEPGYSSSEDGTGLGLSIVEEIGTACGWDVNVSDARDGGARFEITGVDRLESA